ncbi:hypothetical protein [Paraburkholderia sp.]|nr:hypothetical protein [Paraburkholderia sp.]
MVEPFRLGTPPGAVRPETVAPAARALEVHDNTGEKPHLRARLQWTL